MDAAEARKITTTCSAPTIVQSVAVYAAIRKAAEAGKRETTADATGFNAAQRESMLVELRAKGYTARLDSHQFDGSSFRISW